MIIVRWARGIPIMPGFPTLTILISVYSGVTLLSVGILGQYIVRIQRTVTVQKPYVVRRRLD